MKDLLKHIEILLLDHDCVVIPQIGGFVTRVAPACYIPEEHLFLPPYRTVGFNERLKADDGLLVGSYIQAYKCSETEAKRKLGEDIRNLQEELWENGNYDLGSLGVLIFDSSNNVQFAPCQAGAICPTYYGLDGLSFKMLENNAELTAKNTETTHPSLTVTTKIETAKKENNNQEEITIRLKKTWLYNSVAVAAVILAFLFISPDAKNTIESPQARAEFTQLMWLPGTQQSKFTQIDKSATPKQSKQTSKQIESTDKNSNTKQESQQPTQKQKENTNKQIEQNPTQNTHSENEIKKQTTNNQKNKKGNKQESNKKAQANPTKETNVTKGFCVVVASAITQKNAEAFVERLHKNGYSEAQIYKSGDMIRVVFPGYSSEQEARAKKKELSNLSEEFQYAWVYQIE